MTMEGVTNVTGTQPCSRTFSKLPNIMLLPGIVTDGIV